MVPDPADRTAARGSSGPTPFGSRDIGARIGAVLLFGGAALTLLGTVMPNNAELDVEAYWVLAGLQALGGAIVLVLPAKMRRARLLPPLIVAAGVIAVTGVTYYNGERLGGAPGFNEFFYVWPAFYIGYFFGRRGIAVSLVLIAIVYAVLAAEITDNDTEAYTRWVVTISVVSGAAIALHVLRMNIDGLLARLREAARTDPLTSLLNRRGFDERFELELDRARRTGDRVAIVLGDLDRFKDLNDRLGHAAGDTALVAVAQALANGCRSIDTIARVGGEEFALLLPASDAAGGVDAAERLRTEISEIAGSDGRPLTISFGVVDYPAQGDTPEELLDAADEALYTAKALGRDRTVSSEPAAAVATA